MGGTGKTPHVEYVLSALGQRHRIAVLSRGYKRKTKGFLLAEAGTNSTRIGDEPYQMYLKFPATRFAVDENRVHGIRELVRLFPNLELVVLDDAFQHRAVRPGLSVILTDYARLFTRDRLLPAGNLRESRRGSRRADIIVVSKCPPDLTDEEMRSIRQEIHPHEGQNLFFSTFRYLPLRAVFPDSEQDVVSTCDNTGVLLVAGIVSPQAMSVHLASRYAGVETLFFSDHHHFSTRDFHVIGRKIRNMRFKKKIIVVSEKDAARLLSSDSYPDELKRLTYVLPVEVSFLNETGQLFIKKIEDYVTKNSANG